MQHAKSFFLSVFLAGRLAEVQPTSDLSAETFISVQCASPGREGELVSVCGCVHEFREGGIVGDKQLVMYF